MKKNKDTTKRYKAINLVDSETNKLIKQKFIKLPKGYDINETINIRVVNTNEEEILPTTWEELTNIKGYYIDISSNFYCVNKDITTNANKNIYPTKELAKASLALCQLLQLRDKYNDGWTPNYHSSVSKYCIVIMKDKIEDVIFSRTNAILSFKTKELRDLFLKNFIDLIEIAKPLI